MFTRRRNRVWGGCKRYYLDSSPASTQGMDKRVCPLLEDVAIVGTQGIPEETEKGSRLEGRRGRTHPS